MVLGSPIRDRRRIWRARIAGRIHVTADRFIAEGDFVVARGRRTTRQGKPYNNRYCWIYRFTNGEVMD